MRHAGRYRVALATAVGAILAFLAFLVVRPASDATIRFVANLSTGVAPMVATAAARRVLDGLRTPFTLRGNQVPVTASLGVALGAESDLDDLLREADIAMYMAKAHGKARFELAAGEVPAVSRPRV